MIKSTKTTLKFCNYHRKKDIASVIGEYKSVMKQFVVLLWNQPKINRMADKSTCSQIHTWLSARMIQCAGKQASAIVIGTRAKQEKRKYIIEKLIKNGETKNASRLQKIYDESSMSMPELDNVEMELDARFISFDWNNNSSFDGWITISSIGNKMKIEIPVKKTKHFYMF